MPCVVVSKEGPQHAHPISIKICLVCQFHMTISQRVCIVVQWDRAHFHSTTNEDSKSTDTTARAQKFHDMLTYKKFYTPKRSQKLPMPYFFLFVFSMIIHVWWTSSSAFIPSNCGVASNFKVFSSTNLYAGWILKLTDLKFVSCLEFHVHNALTRTLPSMGFNILH